MKTPLPLALSPLIMSLILCGGCEDEPEMQMPVAPPPTEVVEAPEPPPPPPPQEFGVEENALASVKAFEVMPAEATFVIGTSDAVRAAELFGLKPQEELDFGPDHAPDILDLHPASLLAAGFDPERPVGVVVYGKDKPMVGPSWVVFASIKDEKRFREAFSLEPPGPDGLYGTEKEDRRTYMVLENGEVVVASRVQLQTGEEAKTLGADIGFTRLVKALDYGALGAGYIRTTRGEGAFGVGLDEEGLGVKAFAEDELFASTIRLNFAEYAAALRPELPYLQRVINLRAELHASGRQLRKEIDELEEAPHRRRVAASKQILHPLEEVGSLDAEGDSYNVAGRVWRVTPEDIATVYRRWDELGPTVDEDQQLADLRISLEGMEVASTMEVNELAETIIRESTKNGGKVPQLDQMGPMGDMMTKAGGIFAGGGGGKKGDKGPGGMLSNLGGLGKFFGGGQGESKIDMSSSDSRLKRHVGHRAASLAICWGKSEHSNEEFTVKLDMKIDVTGKLSVSRLRGAPDRTLSQCIRKAIGERGAPPKPEPPGPDDPPDMQPTAKPISGWVRMAFRIEK